MSSPDAKCPRCGSFNFGPGPSYDQFRWIGCNECGHGFQSDDAPEGQMTRQAVIDRISSELDRAYQKHGREPWGRHEFYAILKEEVDELWDEIKGDTPQECLIKEAIQVASMVFRYLETGDRYRRSKKGSKP